MKPLYLLILTLMLLNSCTESFTTIDPKSFNEKIANRTDIVSPEKLIKLYYDYPASEGELKVSIQTKELGDNIVEITGIREGLEDDSQSGEKIIMTAKKTAQTWTVVKIKENRKCWEGRGHTKWGATPCS